MHGHETQNTQIVQLHAQSADALSVQEANQIAWDGPLTIYVPTV